MRNQLLTLGSCLMLALSAHAQSLNLTIQGTAQGFNLLADVAANTPYTLTFQSGLAGLVAFDQNASSTFYSTAGSGQGGVTLQIAGRTFHAPDFQFYIHNDIYNPDFPETPPLDGFEFGTINYFDGEGLFFPGNGISIRFYSTNLSVLFGNTAEDFITATSYNPAQFAFNTAFGAYGYDNPDLTGSLSGVFGTVVTGITLGAAIPEPSAFAAIAGAGAFALAATRRRRKV